MPSYLGAAAVWASMLAVVATSASCSRAKPMEVHVPAYRVVPSPSLAFTRSETPSMECPHASSTRSGRVAVAPRRYAALTAVAPIEDTRLGPPRFIDLPARGDAMVLERPGAVDGAYEVRSTSGALATARSTNSTGIHVLAREEGFYVAGRAASWTGVLDPVNSGATVAFGGELLACAIQGEQLRTLVANNGLMTNDGPSDPDNTTAEMESLHGPNSAVRLGWVYRAVEPAVGAIDGGAHTVVALPSGRLVVLSPQGEPQSKEAVLALDVAIDPGATDLSIVPPFALLLYGGGDAGRLAKRRDAGAATSRLDARRPDGSLAWRASLSFLATQPAIDGDHRVYVVGAGIAALDLDGHTLWSSASTLPLRATAFADGTLAVVRGSELQIVANDGSIKQSLRAVEELTTYPAIGPDGAVWVASARTLYVAR
jgi:hypothetical protein